MDLELDDKVVIVTGGSDGLGLASAQAVVAAGGRVTLVGRSADRLTAARAGLPDPGRALTVAADVTGEGELERVVDETMERWGRVDGLVNNAGRQTSGSIETISDAAWRSDFELKVLAAIRGIRIALPHLRVRGGAVVNVLSTWAKFQGPAAMPSSVLRSAGLALTNAVSHDVAPDGVRVNAVLVGSVRSGQTRRMAAELGVDTEATEAHLAETLSIPMGRVGRAEEVGDVVAFLLSPRSSYVTGAGVNLDGGLSPLP